MDKKLIGKISGAFKHDNDFQKFPDFITDIHFPCFKGLTPDSEIKFQFPLTVLVGENGCGKSSVLQALETAPEGKSYSQKWFSTSVDPIPDKPRPAFWYSFNSVKAGRNVEILNQRIQADNNPDYWEPSRPVEKYGMESFPKEMANTPGASGTRWNGTKRHVLYLDFRGELSAFDKYFYFGDKPTAKTLKTKQDYIRYYSRYLKKIIDSKIEYGFRYRNKRKVGKTNKLTPEELKEISFILDKKYLEITIINHGFYKQWGDSVYFKLDNVNTETFKGYYTEAFAGSGESAIAKLVHKIYKAKNGTLVLLDEPEVSLHPGAQKRLLNFLLNQTFEKGLQVIIATHSPAIVEELPKEAIVLLHQTPDGMFSPKCSIEPDLAFQYIGHTNTVKTRIIVEDNAAKELLTACLKLYDDKASQSVDIIFHAGGAEDILKESVILSRLGESNVYFMLDGDKKHCEIRNEKEIASADIDNEIKKITKIDCNRLGFLADGNKNNKEIQQEDEKRKYLTFLKSHLFFFPTDDPEEIMWEASLISKPNLTGTDYKDRVKKWATEEVGEEDCKSSDIEYCRKKLCKNLNKENPYIQTILAMLGKILNQR